jgi:hypothetical protein
MNNKRKKKIRDKGKIVSARYPGGGGRGRGWGVREGLEGGGE